MLETALAPAAGRGLLTSLELDLDSETEITTLRNELTGLAAIQETLRSFSLTSYYNDEWSLGSNSSWRFPSLRSLSLFLCVDCDFPPFLEQLWQSSSTSSRFPLLSDLHVETVADLFPGGHANRVHVASAAPYPRFLDLPALKRLHLGWPTGGIAIALCSLSSVSLEVLSVWSTGTYDVLPTSALAGLRSRCPALRSLRVQNVLLGPSFPATLALWGLDGHYVRCSLTSPLPTPDEAPVWATQFM